MQIQIDSFVSGVGFLDLGFQNAGFDIAFVDEYDERFLYAYKYARRNDPHVHGAAGDDDRRDADGSGVLECSGTESSVPD